MIAPILIAIAATPLLVAFWLVAWLIGNLLQGTRPVVARDRGRDYEMRSDLARRDSNEVGLSKQPSGYDAETRVSPRGHRDVRQPELAH